METNGRTLKIAIVGANQSGKTALTVRFLTGKFIYEYSSGRNFVYQHNYMMDTTVVPMEIVDTSGDNGTLEAVEGSNGVVIVYAINCGKSFKKAREILSNMSDKNENIPPHIALVGTKSDLWPYKSVESDDGRDLAEQYMCEHYELSALSCRDDVREMFSNVIQITIAKNKPRALSLPINLLPLAENTMVKQLSLDESGRSASLIDIQTISDEVKSIDDEIEPIPRSNSMCRKFIETDDEKQCLCQPVPPSTVESESQNVLSSSTDDFASKESLYSSAVDLAPKERAIEKLPKVMRRTVSEISPIERKPPHENKTSILHKTLGDVGFLALSTLQLPVTPLKEKKSRSPFSKRRSDASFLPRPLLVGKTK